MLLSIKSLATVSDFLNSDVDNEISYLYSKLYVETLVVHTHSSYMTLIGVYNMHGQVHPN